MRLNKQSMQNITKNSSSGDLFKFYRYAINRILDAGKAGQYYATINYMKLPMNKYSHFESMLKNRGFTIDEKESHHELLVIWWK